MNKSIIVSDDEDKHFHTKLLWQDEIASGMFSMLSHSLFQDLQFMAHLCMSWKASSHLAIILIH